MGYNLVSLPPIEGSIRNLKFKLRPVGEDAPMVARIRGNDQVITYGQRFYRALNSGRNESPLEAKKKKELRSHWTQISMDLVHKKDPRSPSGGPLEWSQLIALGHAVMPNAATVAALVPGRIAVKTIAGDTISNLFPAAIGLLSEPSASDAPAFATPKEEAGCEMPNYDRTQIVKYDARPVEGSSDGCQYVFRVFVNDKATRWRLVMTAIPKNGYALSRAPKIYRYPPHLWYPTQWMYAWLHSMSKHDPEAYAKCSHADFLAHPPHSKQTSSGDIEFQARLGTKHIMTDDEYLTTGRQIRDGCAEYFEVVQHPTQLVYALLCVDNTWGLASGDRHADVHKVHDKDGRIPLDDFLHRHTIMVNLRFCFHETARGGTVLIHLPGDLSHPFSQHALLLLSLAFETVAIAVPTTSPLVSPMVVIGRNFRLDDDERTHVLHALHSFALRLRVADRDLWTAPSSIFEELPSGIQDSGFGKAVTEILTASNAAKGAALKEAWDEFKARGY